jgi:hypothetical protein
LLLLLIAMAQVVFPLKKSCSSERTNETGQETLLEQMDPISIATKEHLSRIDKASAEIVKTARSYYKTKTKINIVIVTIGVVLLSNSIGYTWIKQSPDAMSIFLGGLGLASFATLFFTKPQENIAVALGNLAQIQMICRSYCLQFDTILDYHIRQESTRQESTSIEEVVKIHSALQSLTLNAVNLVQTQIEKNTSERSREKKQSFSKKI